MDEGRHAVCDQKQACGHGSARLRVKTKNAQFHSPSQRSDDVHADLTRSSDFDWQGTTIFLPQQIPRRPGTHLRPSTDNTLPVSEFHPLDSAVKKTGHWYRACGSMVHRKGENKKKKKSQQAQRTQKRKIEVAGSISALSIFSSQREDRSIQRPARRTGSRSDDDQTHPWDFPPSD
ncbi:hypothetical protein VTO42DRAFT_4787 [Malbranchea cinnamomea]